MAGLRCLTLKRQINQRQKQNQQPAAIGRSTHANVSHAAAIDRLPVDSADDPPGAFSRSSGEATCSGLLLRTASRKVHFLEERSARVTL